jgi:hypothetical protein
VEEEPAGALPRAACVDLALQKQLKRKRREKAKEEKQPVSNCCVHSVSEITDAENRNLNRTAKSREGASAARISGDALSSSKVKKQALNSHGRKQGDLQRNQSEEEP